MAGTTRQKLQLLLGVITESNIFVITNTV